MVNANKKEATLRKTILEIIKYALFSIKPDIPADVDWEAVYDEMCRQGVIGLSNDLLDKLDLDNTLATKWEDRLLNQIHYYLLLSEEQNEIVQAFKNHNIDIVILKGTAAAQYYPTPEYRQMGDVDLIVDISDFERAKAVFEEMQYPVTGDTGRHISFKKDKVEFELHKYFTLDEGTDISRKVNNRIYKMVHHAKQITMDDMTFPALPDFDNGMVLLIHLGQHMREGVGLRHIADWLMYANAKLDDKLWNESFGQAADELGLRQLAITVTRMGQLFLGMSEENMQWCKEADDELCAELLDQIFICGNFTRKQEGKFANAIIYGKQTGFLRNLQDNGIRNWTASQTHTWLQPFAWIYQIGYYINKYRHIETLKEAIVGMHKVKERSKVLTELGIENLE